MKVRIRKHKPVPTIIAVSKQVLLFFLLICFLNTSIFPSLFFTPRQWNGTGQQDNTELLSSAPESCSSLTEYILEDCLHIYNITPDSQKGDVAAIEEVYDEVDLLNHLETNIHFWADTIKIKTYMQDKYPLLLSCFFSPSPPPEC